MKQPEKEKERAETAKRVEKTHMPRKKTIIALVITVLVILLLAACTLVGLNFFVDPSGVFGDRVYRWDAYSMTQNPLIGKMEYLEENPDLYNGYIFGTDGASGYDVAMLNESLGARFYDMSAGDAGMRDVLDTASYIVEKGSCDYVLLEVSPKDACAWGSSAAAQPVQLRDSSGAFYLGKLFASPGAAVEKLRAVDDRDNPLTDKVCYDAKTGACVNIADDLSRPGTTREYMNTNGAKFRSLRKRAMKYTNELTVAIGEFVSLCEKNMVDLYVIVPPLYRNEMNAYDEEEMNHLFDFMSKVTDYYCFCGDNEVTDDARYFYDNTHYRRSVGTSMLSAILTDNTDNMPESFCDFVEKGTAGSTYFTDRCAQITNSWDYEIEVPVIRYGNITVTETGEDNTISAERFEAQIKALSDAGYTAVLYKDLIAYVENGMILPEKPVVIAFDGGYSSVLKLACPILAAHKQCATVAVNGSQIGKSTYAGTNVAMPPHFTLYEAKEYIDAGVLELQSHTYDLFGDGVDTATQKLTENLENAEEPEEEDAAPAARKGVLRLEKESYAEYRIVMENDYARMNELIDCSVGTEVGAVTYPEGAYDMLAEYELHRLGVKVTATSESGVNCLVRGLSQSLYDLYRVNAAKAVDGAALVKMLEMLR